ncbi:insulinase family protein [Thermodesulfobacteriota bacterium]
MSVTYGFELERQEKIEELAATAHFYRHVKTGAELLSLTADDENKVFAITFRTPPSDSTGLPHILEHSVLCGSRKYPVKEPFVELLKGSLQTFLNAFTYPDKTCYPVASQNLTDFYNLIDVYLDAVFYPRLTPFVFQQEGWHYELEDPGQPLSYKGVVFSEMKGAYSSPDNVLSEYSLQLLFPDNPYGFDSGGDPGKIPDLTFEQFENFHKTYYHPSNSRIFFYGDDDPVERLKILDRYLNAFDSIKIESEIILQPFFRKPRQAERPFMASAEGEERAKGMVTVSWLLSETSEIDLNLAFRILGYLLLGMPASPLRKALIESGLGEDIAGDGMGTEIRQIYFSTGLKGVDTKNSERVASIIMETLRDISENGLDPLTVEAAVNTLEFRLRENNPGHFPRGLALMLRALTTWLYDGDPLALLAFEKPLKRFKDHLKNESPYLEGLINKFFLENDHRCTLVLKPDPDLREREEAAEKERIQKARDLMTDEDLDRIAEETLELKHLQETPDTVEALATIPVMKREELEKKNKTIPLEYSEYGQTPILFHDLQTNGIVYLDVGFNLHTLSEGYLAYIPLFGRALLEMGTEKEDYVSLSQRISRKTGGLMPQPFTSARESADGSETWLFLRGKAMFDKGEDLIRILREVLTIPLLDNKERFKQIVLEEKAGAEQRISSAGHQFVNMRLRSHFGEAYWAAEQMGGISYLFFLRDLILSIEKDWQKTLSNLEKIFKLLINRNSMIINLTLDGGNRKTFESELKLLPESLPERSASNLTWQKKAPSPSEGLIIPAQVNYVGKGASLYDAGYSFHGSAQVITRYLRNAFLWDRIRVQGGAYGAFCLFNRLSGVLTFLSYRDPNTLKTLDAFDSTAQFLRESSIGKDELNKSIIGTIGAIDSHMLPDAKGYVSMLRYLTGETEEILQGVRDEILGTSMSHFKAFSEELENVKDNGLVKILGPEKSMEEARGSRPGLFEILKVL